MECLNSYIVNLNILRNNVDNIKRNLKANVKFCAVVKANAYGHGLQNVCKAICDKVDFYGVACLKEALKIRTFDKKSKILILGCVSYDDIVICSKENISISISNLEFLHKLVKSNVKLNIHIQVNTGLNRFGFRSLSQFKKALQIIENNNNIALEGVYSHFASKKEDIPFIKKQFFKFKQFEKCVKNKGVIFHIANSYATLYDKSLQLNMVRSGFLMYGYMDNHIGNLPVLTIKAKLINIHKVKKGDTIGYDRSYVVKHNMTIGVVSMGYADGFDRRLSNGFEVLVGGYKCKVVGYVCMDVFMIDISNVKAKIFDEVVILGKQGNKEVTLIDYANYLNTSPYEVLLRFNYGRMNYIEIKST